RRISLLPSGWRGSSRRSLRLHGGGPSFRGPSSDRLSPREGDSSRGGLLFSLSRSVARSDRVRSGSFDSLDSFDSRERGGASTRSGRLYSGMREDRSIRSFGMRVGADWFGSSPRPVGADVLWPSRDLPSRIWRQPGGVAPPGVRRNT